MGALNLASLSPVVAVTEGTGTLDCLGVGGLAVGSEPCLVGLDVWASVRDRVCGCIDAGWSMELAGSWDLVDGATARRAVGKVR